jgi:hypothetical protein
MNYNPYFPGGAISMARVLYDGLVEYDDGTPATTSQMAKDVVTFLNWAAEPEHDVRKQYGIKAVILFSALTAMSLYIKRFKWSVIKSRKISKCCITYVLQLWTDVLLVHSLHPSDRTWLQALIMWEAQRVSGVSAHYGCGWFTSIVEIRDLILYYIDSLCVSSSVKVSVLSTQEVDGNGYNFHS